MAIGHSGGAFASVEAPKVDFGEIALNAQKFNEADIERQEAKKAAVAKAKADIAKDVKEITVDPASIANGTLEYAVNENIAKEQDKLSYYYEVEKSGRDLTLDERIDKNQALLSAKSLKGMQELVNKGITEVPEAITGSSVISDASRKAWENISRGVGINKIERTKGNDIEVTFFDTDDNGNYIIGEDEKPKILMDVDDDGNEIPVKISLKDLASGNFKSKFYKSNDLPKLIEKYGKTVGSYDTKVENGKVTVGKKSFTEDNINTLNETIKSDLRKDKKYMADIMSQVAGDSNNAKKYGVEGSYNRIRKEYTDEEYKSAEKFLSDRVRGSLDTSYSETQDEDRPINIYNGSGAGVAGSKPIPRLGDKVIERRIGGVLKSFEIPLLEVGNVSTFKGIPITPTVVGVDENGNTFLDFSVADSETKATKYGNISKSNSGKVLKDKRIYYNGPEARADDFINMMSPISDPKGQRKFSSGSSVLQNMMDIFRANDININTLKSNKSIKRSDISSSAAAAGWSPKEYEKLLIQKGIKIE